MKNLKVTDCWENDGAVYVELRLNAGEACCIKVTLSPYVMACYDGNDVYSYVGGADWPLRKLTEKETSEILEFIRKEINNV